MALDILITVSLCYDLNMRRTGFSRQVVSAKMGYELTSFPSRTDNIVTHLVFFIMSRGIFLW